MKKRVLSFLLALCMAFALLPAAVLAATPNVLSIKITMTVPEVGKPLPTTAKTSSTASYEVTKVVEWSGAVDNYGSAIAGVACTFPALAGEEKPAVDKSKTFTQAQADADAAYPKANPHHPCGQREHRGYGSGYSQNT